jgi:hypothetical protein
MPITLKLGELVNARPALEKLMDPSGGLRFSLTTAFKLSRRLKVINAVLLAFDAKRADLVRELGTPVVDRPGKFQLLQVTPDKLDKAKKEATKKREDAVQASGLYRTAGSDTEDATAKTSMDVLVKLADDAEAELPILEKNMVAWNDFTSRTNEMMMADETLDIDPIRLSELQPPENTVCKTCGRSPNEFSVDEVMLLFPLLTDDSV